ncbi:MAG TPA: hypothetical protein VNG33_08270 [Polyangiaceae bacterium]|nr:hypothetical protein [Polyangiaceae bacterium]
MDRRGLLRVATAGALGLLVPQQATASLSRALALTELVARSQHVVLGEPLDNYSVWEQIGQRKHIVTYTRVRALELLAGADPQQDELLVRTLGGQVGQLGELVHGEAVINLGERGVLFTMPTQGVLVVTAMAQGHYPLARDKAGVERLQRSPEAAELIHENGSAVQRLTGLEVAAARALLKQPVRK